jgi:hypothetical protein
MNEWFSLLGEAFNESANYFTWSFYALLTAYIFIRTIRTSPKTRNKKVMLVAGRVVFVVYAAVSAINNVFMSLVFAEKLGTLAQVASLSLGMVMLIVNSIPVMLSLLIDDGESSDNSAAL